MARLCGHLPPTPRWGASRCAPTAARAPRARLFRVPRSCIRSAEPSRGRFLTRARHCSFTRVLIRHRDNRRDDIQHAGRLLAPLHDSPRLLHIRCFWRNPLHTRRRSRLCRSDQVGRCRDVGGSTSILSWPGMSIRGDAERTARPAHAHPDAGPALPLRTPPPPANSAGSGSALRDRAPQFGASSASKERDRHPPCTSAPNGAAV